ncbi:hypothetical protein J2X85_001255 [Microbacterium trichothecenolyticum]|uniref:hypothetical protein n=1 Tax=Microbacterium trichothecenolyticum TaxID=69370 RepID=UPI002865D94A|nr:hypothetical protein [Microbacterium trichothecenolyticum]MDR7184232.1 hypothetical protein [Microbacterium trichothecenolyticum]
MRVVLDAVGKGRREHALPATSAVFESGVATLVAAETAQRPTVLGLIASGRMRPDTGGVTLDDRTDASALRRRVALVDAPEVSEPEPDVTLAGVAAEELMFAGRRSDPVAVRRWLDEHGLEDEASVPVSNVDPSGRVRALCELAVLRKGVEAIVLVSPDRHGGEPAAWWAVAEDFAARGYAVLVIAGQASQGVARSSLVERAKRDETPRTIGRPRVRRLTAPTSGGRA